MDTSIRLGRFFGVSDQYFLNLQNDIDYREAKATHDYMMIQPYKQG